MSRSELAPEAGRRRGRHVVARLLDVTVFRLHVARIEDFEHILGFAVVDPADVHDLPTVVFGDLLEPTITIQVGRALLDLRIARIDPRVARSLEGARSRRDRWACPLVE